jgi:hypothetical protein
MTKKVRKELRKIRKNNRSHYVLADERKRGKKNFRQRQDVRLSPGYPHRAWVWARV